MIRAVLDSSVLVSAFVTPHGRVAELLRQPLRSRYLLCLSETLLDETAKVLLHKKAIRRIFAYEDEDVRDYLGWLLGQAELTTHLPTLDAVPDDPKDNPIVATAVAARAHCLVTGDRAHLLKLGSYGDIAILGVRQFVERLG